MSATGGVSREQKLSLTALSSRVRRDEDESPTLLRFRWQAGVCTYCILHTRCEATAHIAYKTSKY